MFICQCRIQWTAVYLCNGILSSNENEWSMDAQFNMNESWKKKIVLIPIVIYRGLHMTPLIQNVHNRQTYRDRIWALPRASIRQQEWGEIAEKYKISFWKDKNVLTLVFDDNCTTQKKKHCIVIFRCVNYIGCVLYLRSAENEYVYRKFPNFVPCVKSLNIIWKYCILIAPQCKNHSTLYRRKYKHCLMPHQEVLPVYYSILLWDKLEIILDSLILSQTHTQKWK